MEMPPADSRARAKALLTGLQDSICAGLEQLDGEGRFQEESWERPEGGGGRSRVMKGGRVFEQGGVNFSEVEGDQLPPSILSQRPEAEGQRWFATGTSMVLQPAQSLHPHRPPQLPLFRSRSGVVFGGGADLTPYYPFLEDAQHFHRTLQGACDSVHPAYYTVFKPWCDEYFFLRHRGRPAAWAASSTTTRTPAASSTRGRIPRAGSAGRPGHRADPPELGAALRPGHGLRQRLLPSYGPIVEKRQHTPYGERERDFQLYRRGRYVEFNLVFDRGTIFGLQTNGRTESILMSLPPLVRWEYGYTPEAGSREALLTEVFTRPQNWLEDPALVERCRPHQAVG